MNGWEGYMTLKLNMSEAYNRVEWKFLEAVMRRIGFVERWITLATTCTITISYSVLINGQPHRKIYPTQGL
jgi:hypothetical protein